ncbi:peptidoglycan bridge formation glycyltransferase FemA/FemB family protein [Candidatus Woesearchaeota archaeon]|nr:peptidoglycan bridge formation glycyltransferase FemA/FemB family protein [Candidatus Woesearchaeota archaeon]
MEEKVWKELYQKYGKESSVYQSWEWAQLQEKIGNKPLFLTVEQNQKITAGLVCIQKESEGRFRKKTVLFAEGNPLGTQQDQIKLLEQYKTEAKKYNNDIYAATVQQPVAIFEKTKLFRRDSHTIILDLSQPEDIIWGRLEKKSIRWGIKRATAAGIEVNPIKNEEELQEFYKIYTSTALKGKFTAKSHIFFQQILKTFVPEKKAIFLVAKEKKNVVGGILALTSETHAIIHLTGTSEEGMKLQANVLVYWKAIQQAKKEGKQFIDFGGYDIYAKPGEKIYAINQYKERWSGAITPQPIFTTRKKYAKMKMLMQESAILRKLYRWLK